MSLIERYYSQVAAYFLWGWPTLLNFFSLFLGMAAGPTLLNFFCWATAASNILGFFLSWWHATWARTADGSWRAVLNPPLPTPRPALHLPCRLLRPLCIHLLSNAGGGEVGTEIACIFDFLYNPLADISTIFVSDWSHKVNQLEYSPAISYLVLARCLLHRLGVGASW